MEEMFRFGVIAVTNEEAYKHFKDYISGYGYMAKLALAKQIPKKPVQEFGGAGCPCCNTKVCYGNDRKYCENCGQAIDWSYCND